MDIDTQNNENQSSPVVSNRRFNNRCRQTKSDGLYSFVVNLIEIYFYYLHFQ